MKSTLVGALLAVGLLFIAAERIFAQSVTVTPPTYSVTLERDTCDIRFCNLKVAYTAGQINGNDDPFQWFEVITNDEFGNWTGFDQNFYSPGHTGVFTQPLALRPGETVTVHAIGAGALECWEPGGCQTVTAPAYPDQVYCPPPPGSSFVVKAYAETDANPTIERLPSASISSVTVPLGARFRIGLDKVGGSALSSSYQITKQTPSTPTIQPSPLYASLRLFRNHVIFAYQSSVVEEMKLFQAVHLGTAILQVQPTGSAEPIDVTVIVIPPAQLGNAPTCTIGGAWSNTCVDSSVTDIADLSGIPPQYLKGQIEQESTNGRIQQEDAQSYVYEPCRDFERLISLSKFPYSAFTAPNPRGDLLTNDDLSPRSKYQIQVVVNGQTVTRQISSNDTNVTIANIFKTNDCTRRDARGICHGANWSYTCPGVSRQIKANKYANAQIVAQTPIFSSYGRLQMMYTTAVDAPLYWSVANAANPGVLMFNPSLLFDTGAFYFAGGGSMTEGSLEDVGNWHYEMENYGDPSGYNVVADFTQELGAMFHDYNRAWHSKVGSSPYYADYQGAVFARASHYMPVRNGAILRGK